MDLFWNKFKFILFKKLGVSLDAIEVRRGTIDPRLSISKNTKIIVKKTNIFALKNKLFGKNLKIFMKFFNLWILLNLFFYNLREIYISNNDTN